MHSRSTLVARLRNVFLGILLLLFAGGWFLTSDFASNDHPHTKTWAESWRARTFRKGHLPGFPIQPPSVDGQWPEHTSTIDTQKDQDTTDQPPLELIDTVASRLGSFMELDDQSSPTSTTATDSVPSATPLDKVVVVGTVQTEGVDWIAKELPDWHDAVYIVDNTSAPLHTPLNKGREAMVYIQYILDHYDRLPSIIAFVHHHRTGSWHVDNTDQSNVWSLSNIRLDTVQQTGFVNLRCNTQPNCGDEIVMDRQPPDQHRIPEVYMASAWRTLFSNDPMPDTIAAHCCAQFVVTRDRIAARPVSDYQRYLEWLIETPLDDSISGRVFEYLWHIIFGMNAVNCLEVDQCWDDLYGIAAP